MLYKTIVKFVKIYKLNVKLINNILLIINIGE